jgi:GNAT superfamily N-acetyltransferase
MADVHVRPARADDAAEIARIQLATWRTAYARVVPARVLDGVGDEFAIAQWQAAVTAPPTRQHRVLVAQEQQWTVGFAAVGPASEEDLAGDAGPAAAETFAISTLLVEPRWGRRGHGSRLLAAAVDLARQDGFTTGIAWVLEADEASQSFYRSAGWEPDGTGRALDMDGTAVHEIRLHASLLPEPAAASEPADAGEPADPAREATR